ncbi:MAG: hypothetical protein AB1668_02375 [Nanoarchaeota archaeon]
MSIDSVTFEAYKASRGGLTREEFDAVQRHSYTQDQYGEAFRHVSDAVRSIGLGQLPDASDVDMAAKIIGALGERVPRKFKETSPHELWLLTESYHLQGKDTTPIMEAALRIMLSGNL